MPIFEPHIHMFSRVTDDYERMAEAGIRAVLEPAFWLGQSRTSLGSFIDLASVRTRYQLPIANGIQLEPGYRLSVYRYADENRRLWSHAPSLQLDAGLRLARRWRASASLRAEAELGAQVNAAFALASLGLHW